MEGHAQLVAKTIGCVEAICDAALTLTESPVDSDNLDSALQALHDCLERLRDEIRPLAVIAEKPELLAAESNGDCCISRVRAIAKELRDTVIQQELPMDSPSPPPPMEAAPPELADWAAYFEALAAGDLEPYRGMFILIVNGQVVASGSDVELLQQKAVEEYKIAAERAVVTFVEQGECIVVD